MQKGEIILFDRRLINMKMMAQILSNMVWIGKNEIKFLVYGYVVFFKTRKWNIFLKISKGVHVFTKQFINRQC